PSAGSCGAATVVIAPGAAPVPRGLATLATLVMASPGAAPAEIVASKMIDTLPLAGTSIPVTLSTPAPLAPPVGDEEWVLPAGVPTTVKPEMPAGISSVTVTPVAATPADSRTVMV